MSDIQVKSPITGTYITFVFDNGVQEIRSSLGPTQVITTSGESCNAIYFRHSGNIIIFKEGYELASIVSSHVSMEITNIEDNKFCISYTGEGEDCTVTITSKPITPTKKVRLKDNEGNVLYPETSVDMIKGLEEYIKVTENDDGTVDLTIGSGGAITPKGYKVTFSTLLGSASSRFYYTVNNSEHEIKIVELPTLNNVSKISFRVEKMAQLIHI